MKPAADLVDVHGFNEAAKEAVDYLIDKANISGRTNVNYDLKTSVPEEHIVNVMSLLKQRLRKLGYKVKSTGSLLVVTFND